MRKELISFFIVFVGIFFFGGEVLAQEVHCSFSSPVPLNGRTTAHCQAIAKHFCLIGKKIEKADLFYDDPSGVASFMQTFDCNRSSCEFDLPSERLDKVGRWNIMACVKETCSFLAGSWTKCVNVGWVDVLPPRCGDGVINQPGEECDDGNNISGDGCDANCRLEGAPPGPTQPTQPTGYDNPLLWADIPQFLLYALRFIFNLLLGISILMIVVAGIFLAASRGDPIRQAKGKRTLMFAAIGLSIALLAQGLFMLFRIIFGVRF